MLDEIKENEVPKVLENQEHQQLPQTPASVRRYTGFSRPHKWFSPSLYYLLMIDSSEPGCCEEVMQVETIKMWEQGMDEEMKSLVIKSTWDLVQFHIGRRKL